MRKKEPPHVKLDPELLIPFCKALESALGLEYPEKEWAALAKKMGAVAHELGFGSAEACMQSLAQRPLTPEQITALAEHLTIGETYFFRDSSIFQVLEQKILPEIIEKHRSTGRNIRIWCAACCSGEEPYSLAILLDRLIPDSDKWDISILGSDINPIFLDKARRGVYKKWSFRATPKAVLEKYFSEEAGGTYKIVPKIRRMVSFIALNLIEDQYPAVLNKTHCMDLILCNNVLIYFSKEKIQSTIRKLAKSIVADGNLIVSALEVPYVDDEYLESYFLDGMTLFRKLHAPKTKQVYAPEPILVKKFMPPPPPQPPELVPRNEPPLKPEKHALTVAEIKALFDSGAYDEVIRAVEAASTGRESDNVIKLQTLLSRSFANQGRTDKAIDVMQRVLKEEKLDPELFFFYGTLHHESGNYEEAVRAYKKALFLDHNFVLGYYALGNTLMALGKKEEAARNFRNVLKLLDKLEENTMLIESEAITAGLLKEICSIHK